MGPHCTGTLPLVTSGGHQWKPDQTCSFQDPLVPPSPDGADIWWLLKYIRSAQVGGMHPTGMSISIVLMVAV